MFKSTFQGGPSVEVFSAQGKEPLSQWKQIGNAKIQKEFDTEVKSYVIHLEGSNTTTKMQLPKESKHTLGLTQRYVILQVFAFKDKDFCLDIGVSDGSSKRRLVLSTTHKDIHVTPLHSKLPMGVVHKNLWLNLCFDLTSLVADTWKGEGYKSLESISIQGTCKLRRIFTMKAQPVDTTDDEGLYGCPPTNNNVTFESIPKQCMLAPDVNQMTQVINIPKLQCFEKRTKLQDSSRSTSEQDLSGSLNSTHHGHGRKYLGTSHQSKRDKDTDRRSSAKDEERRGSGKESDRKLMGKENERKGSGKDMERLGVRENERKGSGKEGERRGVMRENGGERKGSGKEAERSKQAGGRGGHHSRSKSDSVTGSKIPTLHTGDRTVTSASSKKTQSRHSPERRGEGRQVQRERRDSDPGASQVDDDVLIDKDSLRSSHTWTDGADGKDQIPFVKPHPPSEPSSAKHRRPPRVKSAGKERTPHAGHVFYIDSVQSGSSANTTPPNGEVEPSRVHQAAPTTTGGSHQQQDEYQMADLSEMVDIMRSMQRENGQHESESDVDSIVDVIGVLNNRTDENTGGEYAGSEDSVMSDDRTNHEHRIYTYSSKPKEAPHMGGQQQGTISTKSMEPHKLLQQHKSNRTRVRKKSHEKKMRVRSRNSGGVVGGGGDGGLVNGQKKGHVRTSNDSEFLASQSSDEEDNNPTPRQIKKRSPRAKPLKRSPNNPQYSNAIYSENRHQNNLLRISPIGKPLHNHHVHHHHHMQAGLSQQMFPAGSSINPINSSTYRIDPVMYGQQGLLQVPPSSHSPHLLQGSLDPGSRRSQTSISFSRKSLREIPHDEIRRSGGSRAYNKDLYEMPEYLSESRERSMLQGICSDDELDELDDQDEKDLTKKGEYHFTAGSSSEDNTPVSTLKATGERDHDYLEEMERNKFSDENPLTCSNQRLFSPDMFHGQEKNSPYQLSPIAKGATRYNNSSSHNDQSSEDEELELMFDYILGCYFDPKSGIYYQLK